MPSTPVALHVTGDTGAVVGERESAPAEDLPGEESPHRPFFYLLLKDSHHLTGLPWGVLTDSRNGNSFF